MVCSHWKFGFGPLRFHSLFSTNIEFRSYLCRVRRGVYRDELFVRLGFRWRPAGRGGCYGWRNRNYWCMHCILLASFVIVILAAVMAIKLEALCTCIVFTCNCNDFHLHHFSPSISMTEQRYRARSIDWYGIPFMNPQLFGSYRERKERKNMNYGERERGRY